MDLKMHGLQIDLDEKTIVKNVSLSVEKRSLWESSGQTAAENQL